MHGLGFCEAIKVQVFCLAVLARVWGVRIVTGSIADRPVVAVSLYP